ncbi:MAG: GNAT family N-acetyltransferase [Pseudomonadota bacterium]
MGDVPLAEGRPKLKAAPSPRPATADDADAVRDILTAAFADDPVMSWCFGAKRPIGTLFREMVAGCYLRRGFAHIIDEDAATLWLPCGQAPKLNAFREMRIAGAILASGGFSAVRRSFRLADAVENSHPATPHYYLFAVGVRTEMQGRGLGRRVIQEGLALADRDGAPAYLENSRARNAPLYQSLGFRKCGDIPLPEGAPPLAPMWRDARPPMASSPPQ